MRHSARVLMSALFAMALLQGCGGGDDQRAPVAGTVTSPASIEISHQPSVVYTSVQGVHVDAANPGPTAYANNQYLTWMFHLVFNSKDQAYQIEKADIDYHLAGKTVWKESYPRESLEKLEWIEGGIELTEQYFLDNIEFAEHGMKSLEKRTTPDIPKGSSVSWVRINAARPFHSRIDEVKFDFVLKDAAGAVSSASHIVPITEWQQKVRLRLPFNDTWVAASGNDLATGHRRTGLNGLTTYGWDFMKVGANGKTYRTDGVKPEDYYTYRAEVLAPGDGTVIDLRNDIDETPIGKMPPRALVESDGDVFSGNMVVIDHGNGEYTLTCHILKGSVKVKKGDSVKAGQLLGLAGNSGVSGHPHVHMNLMDGPHWLKARGIPSQFSDFERVIAKGLPKKVALGNPLTDWLVRPDAASK